MDLATTGTAASPGDPSFTFWGSFEEDREAGRIVRRVCNLATVLDEAIWLSAAHTISQGRRSFGIPHAAAARVLGVEQFRTVERLEKRLGRVTPEQLALVLEGLEEIIGD